MDNKLLIAPPYSETVRIRLESSGAWEQRPSAPFKHDVDVARALRYLAPKKQSDTSDAKIDGVREENIPEITQLCRRLTERRFYPYARRLARLALHAFSNVIGQDATGRWAIARSLIISTYKDPEVSALAALSAAQAELTKFSSRSGSYGKLSREDQIDVLAIEASMARRRWEATADVGELRRAFELYSEAYGSNPNTSNGYPAVNAAFVLDLFSWAIRDGGATSSSSRANDDDPATRMVPDAAVWESPAAAARQIRRRLIESESVAESSVTGAAPNTTGYTKYWRTAVLTEAHFGIGNFDAAAKSLAELVAMPTEREMYLDVTLRQLGMLARVQELPREIVGLGADVSANTSAGAPDAWRALLASHPEVGTGLRCGYIGKLGIAFSGGGFRAALFHVGLLARLAELDVLRHVELLSCVSGGAIVGALYYLEVKRLLEVKPDDEIRREDFVAVVDSVRGHLQRCIETDLRNTLLADAAANLQSATEPSYSRTRRLGELLDETLYGFYSTAGGEERLFLDELYVEPATNPSTSRSPDKRFNPRLDNWRRAAKVPTLILNSTCLNTGHVWQFTASWMGEPPKGGGTRDRLLPRLRRIRFSEPKARDLRVAVGDAVAASAAVPMTFEPLILPGLYRDFEVALSDGGVHDNQGIASLLDQGCTTLIVSDASGQIRAKPSCSVDPFTVGQRANDILMARVRNAQLAQLDVLQAGRALNGLLVVHLRHGLETGDVPPTYERSEASNPAQEQHQTNYGIGTDVQRRLAELRTDLDAFHELESFALQESAYRMTFTEAARNLPWANSRNAPAYRWSFRAASPIIAEHSTPSSRAVVVEELAIGAKLFGKQGRRWVAPATLLLLVCTVALAAISGVLMLLQWTTFAAGMLAVAIVAPALGVVLAWPSWHLRRVRDFGASSTLWERVSGRALAWFVAPTLQSDRTALRSEYLERGRLRRYHE